jgi:hypothetical protein
MSAKDYKAIADILAAEIVADAYGDFQCGLEWNRCRIADKLAQHFERENPNFNRERFLTAAKVD